MQDHRIKKYLFEEIVGESDNDIQECRISKELRYSLEDLIKVGSNIYNNDTLKKLQEAINKQIINLSKYNRGLLQKTQRTLNDQQLLLLTLKVQTLALQKLNNKNFMIQPQLKPFDNPTLIARLETQFSIQDLQKLYIRLKNLQNQVKTDNQVILDLFTKFQNILEHLLKNSDTHHQKQLSVAQQSFKHNRSTQEKTLIKIKNLRKQLTHNFKDNYNKVFLNSQTEFQKQIMIIIREYSKHYNLIQKQVEQVKYWHRQQIKEVQVVFQEIKSMEQYIKQVTQSIKMNQKGILEHHDKFNFLKKIWQGTKSFVQTINENMEKIRKRQLQEQAQTQQKEFFRMQIKTFNEQMLQKDSKLKQTTKLLQKQKSFIRSRQQSQSKAIRQRVVMKQKLIQQQTKNTELSEQLTNFQNLKNTEIQFINKLINFFNETSVWQNQLNLHKKDLEGLPIVQLVQRQIQHRKKLTSNLKSIKRQQKQYLEELGEMFEVYGLQNSSSQEKQKQQKINVQTMLQMQVRILKEKINTIESKRQQNQKQLIMNEKLIQKWKNNTVNLSQLLKSTCRKIQHCIEVSQIDDILDKIDKSIHEDVVNQFITLFSEFAKMGKTIANRYKVQNKKIQSQYQSKYSSLNEKQQNEKNKLSQTNNSLKTEIYSVAQSHKQTLQEILNLQQRRKQLQKQIQMKQEEIIHYKQLTEKLQIKNKKSSQENSMYQKQQLQFKNVIEKLIHSVEENKEFYEKQNKKELNNVRQLKLALFEAQSSIKQLQNQVKLLKAQHQTLNTWLQKQRQDFNHKIQQQKNQNSKLKLQIKQLKFNNQMKQKQYEHTIHSLQKQKQQQKRKIEQSINNKQDYLKNQQLSLIQARDDQFRQKIKYQKQLAQYHEKINFLKIENMQYSKTNKILEKQIEMLTHEKIKQAQNYQHCRNQHQKEIEILQQQIKKLTRKLKQLEKKRQVCVENMQQIVQNQSKTIKQLRNTIFKKQEEIRKVNDKYIISMIEMKKTIEKQCEDNKQKYKYLMDKKQRVYKDDVQNVEKQILKMKENLQNMRLENISLRETLEQLSYYIEKNNINLKTIIPTNMYSTNYTNLEKYPVQGKANKLNSDTSKPSLFENTRYHLSDRKRAFSYNCLKQPNVKPNYHNLQYF